MGFVDSFIFKENNTGHWLREWKEGGIGDQGEVRTVVSVESGWTTEMYDCPTATWTHLVFVTKSLKCHESSGLCVFFPPVFSLNSRISIGLGGAHAGILSGKYKRGRERAICTIYTYIQRVLS